MTEKNNLLHTAFDEAYTYDALNRLTSSTDESFAMDALGNITTADGTSRTSNSQNQLTVVGSNDLAYDNNGNTTTDDQGHTLAYDAWNRLISVKNGGTLLKSYTYDGMGRRVTEYDGSSWEDLYYSTQGQVLEGDKAGYAYVQNVWSPVYVNALVLRDRDANNSGDGVMEERIYVTQDANFDVTSMVAYASSTWSVSVRVVYNAYGSATFYTSAWASGSNSYAMSTLFQGMRYDAATGLYHAGARDYSATMMTWVQQDPIGFVDGPDVYHAMADNPIDMLDPQGTDAWGLPMSKGGTMEETAAGWKAVELATAGIDGSAWDPSKGFTDQSGIVHRVYAFYQRVYQANNNLQWAGMAVIAGNSVVAGLEKIAAAEAGAGAAAGMVGKAMPLVGLAGGELKALDSTLLGMQKAIWGDIGWVQGVYVDGGMCAIEALHNNHQLRDDIYKAMKQIDRGNVWAGNDALLKREQQVVLAPGYAKIDTILGAATGMSHLIDNPFPGGGPFTGNDITDFSQRWSWILMDMVYPWMIATQAARDLAVADATSPGTGI